MRRIVESQLSPAGFFRPQREVVAFWHRGVADGAWARDPGRALFGQVSTLLAGGPCPIRRYDAVIDVRLVAREGVRKRIHWTAPFLRPRSRRDPALREFHSHLSPRLFPRVRSLSVPAGTQRLDFGAQARRA